MDLIFSQDMDLTLGLKYFYDIRLLPLLIKCFSKLSLLDCCYHNKNAGTGLRSQIHSCYYVNYGASETYSEARSRCIDIGGNLTSVLDQEEGDFLYGELNSET